VAGAAARLSPQWPENPESRALGRDHGGGAIERIRGNVVVIGAGLAGKRCGPGCRGGRRTDVPPERERAIGGSSVNAGDGSLFAGSAE